MKLSLASLFLALLAVLPAAAQEDSVFLRLELRVITARPGGIVVIDRGTGDGLAVGDRVELTPHGGTPRQGSVVELDERSAFVEFDDWTFVPEPGTRGLAFVPATRFARPEPEPSAVAPAEAPPVSEPAPEETAEDGWQPGMPLLARIQVLEPSERDRTLTGRAYLMLDETFTSESGRSDHFYRYGANAVLENPIGRGGALHVDAELNHRATEVPDQETESYGNLRVDRASYTWGGSRFEPERHEAGRFLQHTLPELGLLDGYEWSKRRLNGQRFGASAGFMPQPDPDLDSGHDFQLAAWYEWIADPSERFSAAGAFQKTWHNGAPDRDLLLGRVRWLPEDGWTLHGTAWVDVYTSGDVAHGSGVDLTQLIASAHRRYDSGRDLSVAFAHVTFPDIERNEFLAVLPDQIANARSERLTVSGSQPLSGDRRLHGSVGIWNDEQETGGNIEGGLEVLDYLLPDSRADGALFFTQGQFSTIVGGRISYGAKAPEGRWDLFYELSNVRQQGFANDNDDLIHHWLRGSWDLFLGTGWDASLYAEVRGYGDEGSISAGLFLQRSF